MPAQPHEEGSNARQRKRESLARSLVLVAAFISFVFSVSLWFSGNEHEGIFVGVWVPTILSLGTFMLPRR